MPAPPIRRRRLLAALALLPAACAAPGRAPPGRPAERAAARPAPARATPPAAAPPRAVAIEPLSATFRVRRRANLRRGPSTRDPVLAVLPVGTVLQATGRVEGADWLEVRHGRLRGFVQADLVAAAASGAGGDEAALPVEPAAAEGEAPGGDGS